MGLRQDLGLLDEGTEEVGRDCGHPSASLVFQIFTLISDSWFFIDKIN